MCGCAFSSLMSAKNSSKIGATDDWSTYLVSLNWGPGNRDKSAHNAFLRAASLKIDPQVAAEVVAKLIRDNGGSFSSAKLQNQLRRAYEFVGTGTAVVSPLVKPPSVAFEPEKLKEFASKAGHGDAQWIKNQSPVPADGVTSAEFLNHIYEAGERILIFTDLHSQGEVLFEAGGDNPVIPKLTADGVWFLVNPVDGKEHPNPRQENKISRRSEESITSWRYLVLESDVADPQQWLQCLAQLPLRISAIYTSGGKSIHALVRVDASSKGEWDQIRNEIKPLLITLGADEAAMTGVRLSRLPGALRGLQKQELLYLNPSPKDIPIIHL